MAKEETAVQRTLLALIFLLSRSPLAMAFSNISPPPVLLAPSYPALGQSSFMPRRSRPSCASVVAGDQDARHFGVGFRRRRCGTSSSPSGLVMLRNFDLPEAVVFYGSDVAIDRGTMTAAAPAPRPGVVRLLDECAEVGTAAIVLTETIHASELEGMLRSAEAMGRRLEDGTLAVRSSLDVDCVEFPPEADDDRLPFGRGGIGHAPSPAALLDALSSVCVEPRGFGGSSGFGTKAADPPRPPLPKHAVVFVSGPSERSRARCSAARMAGARVVYVETEGMGSCDAEDLSDAVVETLGDEDDWEAVTLDGISTPGSYWLNPPNPRDDEGNRVNIEEVVEFFQRERVSDPEDGEMVNNEGDDFAANEGEMDEEEMNRILADLDSL
eukprot:CAMPEP_0183302832 /NCGR_PEP_ID=MMETSP0160_2-20130417/8479_1 /TAXON_ID=2839 ORGANISM="Odontella Sinensis, Strain Grunow 1884" /NCGR_SAMPLE_ID=MMETSP0160_2 /ASSEMBLY_ACC=CAM_ASM_000250 /LENGTH=382 /DNA_ID=CAMNT_0025465649 /DNA_START=108 /DNA_END=1256 /DNA_ORIENTATION=+